MQSRHTQVPVKPKTRTVSLSFLLESVIWSLFFLFILVAGSRLAPQNDTWWHLRTGQWIVEHGAIPLRDPFTLTVPGAYWPNHSWLAAVLFFGAYQFGGLWALACLSAVVLGVTWLLVYQLCEGPASMRVLALLVAMYGQYVTWTMRAHLFSFLFAALCLWLVPRKRLHWMYPLVFLVWANTHAGVAFGGVVIIAALFASVITDRTAVMRWVVIGTLCVLATLVNPMGIGLWQYVVGAFQDPIRSLIEEWQPPRFDSPNSYPFFVLLVVWCGAVVARRKRWHGLRDYTLLLAGMIFLLLATRSIRHSATFALVVAPVLTRVWSGTLLQDERRTTNDERKSFSLSSVVQKGMLVIGAVFTVGALGFLWRDLDNKPPLSPTIVAGIRSCQGPLFNSYEDGGPLLWFVPERPIFIDSRQDPFPASLILQTSDAVTQGTYQALFKEYNIACALVPVGQPLEAALQSGGWQTLAQDQSYIVMRAR